VKTCPKCSAQNPSDAWLCSCGYEFAADESEFPTTASKQASRLHRILLITVAAFLTLLSASIAYLLLQPENTTTRLHSVAVTPVAVATRKEYSPEGEARLRAYVAEERKALEEAPSRPAAEVMPKLVRSAGNDGINPDEIRLGFNRRELAVAAIKKVPGYEQWFRDRLRTLFPPGFVERDTRAGRRKLVAISDQAAGAANYEQGTLLRALRRLATDEAIRVLADYLWDDRLIYPPGDDYGSLTLSELAGQALSEMRLTRELIGSPMYREPAGWREWWIANKASFAPQAE
jgi:hypothetical protein